MLSLCLQHVHGGPIIAVQVENEFGSYSSEVEHLLYLKKVSMFFFNLKKIMKMIFSCKKSKNMKL